MGRIFTLLNALQDIFFSLLIALQDFFPKKSVMLTFAEFIYTGAIIGDGDRKRALILLLGLSP